MVGIKSIDMICSMCTVLDFNVTLDHMFRSMLMRMTLARVDLTTVSLQDMLEVVWPVVSSASPSD